MTCVGAEEAEPVAVLGQVLGQRRGVLGRTRVGAGRPLGPERGQDRIGVADHELERP